MLRLSAGDSVLYIQNPLKPDLFRAGHAHAGVLLVLSLIVLRYVDEANLSGMWKGFVRHSIPLSAILLPMAFFFSVVKPDADSPNGFIYLAYIGAFLLGIAMIALGAGLVRKKKQEQQPMISL